MAADGDCLLIWCPVGRIYPAASPETTTAEVAVFEVTPVRYGCSTVVSPLAMARVILHHLFRTLLWECRLPASIGSGGDGVGSETGGRTAVVLVPGDFVVETGSGEDIQVAVAV
jgi:hypothetical protein